MHVPGEHAQEPDRRARRRPRLDLPAELRGKPRQQARPRRHDPGRPKRQHRHSHQLRERAVTAAEQVPNQNQHRINAKHQQQSNSQLSGPTVPGQHGQRHQRAVHSARLPRQRSQERHREAKLPNEREGLRLDWQSQRRTSRRRTRSLSRPAEWNEYWKFRRLRPIFEWQ